ncbi:hypothetical protein I5L01_12220 [Erythrobacter sp. YJ-T3-07]|uniref:hypothetical protein n=1 Tax=Erythrobacter sp. YJ-T3-07 TaxID=2793063 RepID=UPI0018D48DFC|nr:hypothetical protein [Erythrobacter sp. YJ-T3-07]MBH1944986.1 hypothetical protein [Erythrobacter sp. YJ-T3-07]
MPQKNETRAGKARASRNSCGGWFRDPLTSPASPPQAIPELIALHLGERFLSRLEEGGVGHV